MLGMVSVTDETQESHNRSYWTYLILAPLVCVGIFLVPDMYVADSSVDFVEILYLQYAAGLMVVAFLIISIISVIKLSRALPRLTPEACPDQRHKLGLSIWIMLALAFFFVALMDGIVFEFVPLVFGEEYLFAKKSIMALSPTIPGFCLICLFGWRMLHIKHQRGKFVLTIGLGVVLNVALALRWVPDHAAFGVAAATTTSVLVVLAILVCCVYNDLPLSHYTKTLGPFAVLAAVSYCVIRLVALPIWEAIGTTDILLIAESLAGIVFYFGALWYWSSKTHCPEFMLLFKPADRLPAFYERPSRTTDQDDQAITNHFSLRYWLEEAYTGPMADPIVPWFDEHQRKMLASILTYGAYAFWLFFSVLYTSFFARYIPILPIYLSCVGVFVIAELIAVGKNKRILLCNAVLFAIITFMTVMFFPSAGWGCTILAFAFYARNYNMDDFARMSLVVTSIALFVVVASAQADIIESSIETIYRTRYLLGFLGALYGPQYAFIITLLTIYLSKERFSLVSAALLVLVNFYLFVYTDSRLSFYLSCIIIVIALIFSASDRRGKQPTLPPLFVASIFTTCFIISVVVALLYDPNNQTWTTLNGYFGRRISLAYNGLYDYGITLFGQDVGDTGNGFDPYGNIDDDLYDYIDNAYIKLLVRWGVVWTIIYLALWSISTYFASAKKDPYLALCFVIIALHCLIDDLMLQLPYNPFFLVSGIAILALFPQIRKFTAARLE